MPGGIVNYESICRISADVYCVYGLLWTTYWSFNHGNVRLEMEQRIQPLITKQKRFDQKWSQGYSLWSPKRGKVSIDMELGLKTLVPYKGKIQTRN